MNAYRLASIALMGIAMASSKKGSGEHPSVKEYLRNLEAFEKEASSKPPPPEPTDSPTIGDDGMPLPNLPTPSIPDADEEEEEEEEKTPNTKPSPPAPAEEK